MDKMESRLIFVRMSISTGETFEIENSLHMDVKIKKTTSPAGNEADISIFNINPAIASAVIESSGKVYSKRTDKKTCTIQVTAGYTNSELSDIFFGDVVFSEFLGLSDRVLNIKAKTSFYEQVKLVSKSFDQLKTKASIICQSIASDMGLPLNFNATDTDIYRYCYSGTVTDQLRNLLFDYGISCFVDDKILIAKDVGQKVNYNTKIVDADSQMVGIPKPTEHGIDAVTLFDAGFKIGGQVQITSVKNPSVNGVYIAHQLQYDLSNYSNNFYMTIITAKPKDTKTTRKKKRK